MLNVLHKTPTEEMQETILGPFILVPLPTKILVEKPGSYSPLMARIYFTDYIWGPGGKIVKKEPRGEYSRQIFLLEVWERQEDWQWIQRGWAYSLHPDDSAFLGVSTWQDVMAFTLRKAEPEEKEERMTEHSHIEVLLAMIFDAYSSEALALPWSCEKREAFWGPGTEHAWQIISESGETIVYLKSSVDGPSFVAAVNEFADSDLQKSIVA